MSEGKKYRAICVYCGEVTVDGGAELGIEDVQALVLDHVLGCKANPVYHMLAAARDLAEAVRGLFSQVEIFDVWQLNDIFEPPSNSLDASILRANAALQAFDRITGGDDEE